MINLNSDHLNSLLIVQATRPHNWQKLKLGSDVSAFNDNTLQNLQKRKPKCKTPTLKHPFFQIHPILEGIIVSEA